MYPSPAGACYVDFARACTNIQNSILRVVPVFRYTYWLVDAALVGVRPMVRSVFPSTSRGSEHAARRDGECS